MKNVKYNFDFDTVQFADTVSKKTFSIMNNEVLQECFDEDGNYISYASNTAILTAILKHCSNFPVQDFTDEEMFQICEYSNLYHYILNSSKNPVLSSIYSELQQNIRFAKYKAIHASKIDEIITALIKSLNNIDLTEIVNEENIEKTKNIVSSIDNSINKSSLDNGE